MNTHSVVSRPVRRTLLVAAAAVLTLAGCGDDSSSSTSSASGAGAIEVSGAWARTSPAVASAGAVYMTIANSGSAADALVSATVDPSVAARVELHETTLATTATTVAMSNGSVPVAGAMMEMKPVDQIAVPAGGSVTLEPGGYHIMLRDVVKPLEVGSTVELTLTFEKSGDKVVAADVRDTTP
jgi:periplasmic copper chaperone A